MSPRPRATRFPVLLLLLIPPILLSDPAAGQVGDPTTPRVHAFTNARIVVAPGRVIESGTLVIRDGVIEAAGSRVTPPPDARIWPSAGFTIYPGFIDPYVPAPKPDAKRGAGATPPAGEVPPDGIAHENEKVRPETEAAADLPLAADFVAGRRNAGFAIGNLTRPAGIFRGASSIVSFGAGDPRRDVIRPRFAEVIAFETGDWNARRYPGSLMGVIALIRQTLADADGYRADQSDYRLKPLGRERPETNDGLATLLPVISGEMPALLATDDYQSFLRADAVAAEFKVNALLLGSGHEYNRVDAIRKTGRPILLPVDFPAPPQLKDSAAKRAIDIADLRHWALAPGNPAALARAGVTFAFTADGLEKPGAFRERVAEAIARGLDADRALAACTTIPAGLMGISNIAGTLEPGKVASFFIASGDAFNCRTKIQDVWVDGAHFEVREDETGPAGADRAAGEAAEKAAPGDAADRTAAGGESPDSSDAAKKLPAREAALRASTEIAPAGLMGESEAWRAPVPDAPAAILVKNAVIWTSGPQGRLDNADLLVRNGRIAAVGPGLTAPAGALVIDAKGKQVTPGLIDCHSHTAISGGVNEGTNNVTAEVRIGDVVNAETVNIYRELAGGLTTVNLLHGSANAIGGQNQVIKMRYGALADQLKFEGAMPGIKFALGENPKQSNWGLETSDRYPKSRMGVEQLIRERFLTAADYEKDWADFRSGHGRRPRRDLQLEAIQEILDGKRLIHCHSYRQDEILMLMRLCEEFGVKVGTFQHVLEGYKVADEIAAHGASASTFSDWWTYKAEVRDAIPYNGALMTDRGVTVSFNSDSSELARRMNTEAAKAVKYGGLSEEEALKLVTLNPARQLHIADRVGSLEPGKDADFVIWSGSPLSNLARCEQTWVDGRRYFDRDQDLANRAAFEREREALIGWAGKARTREKSGLVAERIHPGYLDEDGSEDACHDDGAHRRTTGREDNR